MSDLVGEIQSRGEYASIAVVALLLWLSVGPTARLLDVRRREVGDLFWNGALAFIVVGRLAYVVAESPRTLLDPLVLIRVQGGIEPLAGVCGVAAIVAWHTHRRGDLWAWLTAGAVGLTIATVGYDLSCELRDACFGATAPAPLGFRMSGLNETRLATPVLEAIVLLSISAAILTFARRLPARAVPLLLIAALALTRAALTPASVLGLDAVGIETALLAVGGATALMAAIARAGPAPARAGR